jgi:hypothetical protein
VQGLSEYALLLNFSRMQLTLDRHEHPEMSDIEQCTYCNTSMNKQPFKAFAIDAGSWMPERGPVVRVISILTHNKCPATAEHWNCQGALLIMVI